MDFEKTIQNTPGLIEKLANLKKDPLAVTPVLFAKIKILWNCNLSCIFCELPCNVAPMPEDHVAKILNTLKNLGVAKIHFSGGEVFLHPDIFSILENACNMGLQVNLTTNGTLLDKEKIQRLADIGVHSVTISLDAMDAKLHDKLRGKKGAFKAAVKAIQKIAEQKKKKPKLRINTVLTSLNAQEMDTIHNFLQTFDRKISWKILPVDTDKKKLRPDTKAVDTLVQKAEKRDLLEEIPFWKYYLKNSGKPVANGRYGAGYYGSHPCYMPWLHLFIDPGGFVYPCCMSRGKIPAMGNCFRTSLEDILSGKKSNEIRMNMAAGQVFDVCFSCDDFFTENFCVEHNIAI